MAQFRVKLTLYVECDDPTGDKISENHGITAFAQSAADSTRRQIVGEGQYRGDPIEITDVRLTGVSRYR